MKKSLYLLLALIISCSPKEASNNSEPIEEIQTSEKAIVFSQEQIKLAGIEIGKLEKQKISETVECSGKIEVPPGNIASVSPIIRGFIKSLNYFPGDFVEKGAVLAYLQHPDFIQLQQQYLEAKSQADYYQEEYKRQGELTVENAASIKKMQKAKADYLHFEATSKSLKSQLELLGINTSKIEIGDFIKEFKLIAPITGTVSQLNANKGKYVSSENFIYEIINDNTLNLHFNVFEKDISKIKAGQKIIFWSLNNSEKHEAKVKRIGIKIDEQSRTTMVHSKINNKNQSLKPGMFINASVYINERESYTLPTESVVIFNNESYIFINNDNSFNLVKIKKGIEQDGFYEILEISDELINAEIVITGTYYLLSKLEAEQ